MLASIAQTLLLFCAQASRLAPGEEADGGGGPSLFTLCFFVATFWLFMKWMSPGEEKPRAKPAVRGPKTSAARPQTGQQNGIGGVAHPIHGRVTVIHAVTPGQSHHEYNVGNPSRSRGPGVGQGCSSGSKRASAWHRV
jgi:hypothetical protein